MHDLFEETFDDLIGQARQRIADRKTMTEALVAAGKPVKMKNQSGGYALVCPDMSTQSGKWRVSYFDADRQPLNHIEHPTAADAFTNALRDGYRPFVA